MIRILLVDDHTMIREALRMALERDGSMQVVAEAGDGETALQQVAELLPEVVVMDIALPGASGIEVTRRLHASHPAIKVLALSTHLDRGIIKQMLDAGASGYVVKSAAGTELQQGIRSLMAGRKYLCSETAALVATSLTELLPASGKSDKRGLSGREIQVLVLIAEGKSAPAIATELHLSPGTVEVHRRNIMRKLDLHNVVELTKYAIRSGLITP